MTNFPTLRLSRNDSEAVQEAEEAAAAEAEPAVDKPKAPVMAVEAQSEPEHTLAQHQVRAMIIFMTLSGPPVMLKFLWAECAAAFMKTGQGPTGRSCCFTCPYRCTMPHASCLLSHCNHIRFETS